MYGRKPPRRRPGERWFRRDPRLAADRNRVRHPDGRQLDLNPVTLTADGGGDQIQRDGVSRWHYARPVVGRIGGRSVECCSVQTQVDAHLGYEPDDHDRQDMAVLGEVFNVILPPPYDRP